MKNKKIKLFEYLCEELKDIPTDRRNYHYTNFPALIEILKSGQLLGNNYYTKSDKGDDDRKSELSTIRDSGMKRLEKSEYVAGDLSSNIDGVKFTLYTDRILAGVRGAKLSKIAEFPKQFLDNTKWIKYEYKRRHGETFPTNRELKDKNFNSLWYAEKVEKDKTKVQDAKNLIDQYITNMKAASDRQRDSREQEERFVHDLRRGIPLDPRFMKIEIIKRPRQCYWEDRYEPNLFKNPKDYTEENKKTANAWRKVYNMASKDLDLLLKTSPELLVRNEIYGKLVSELKRFKPYVTDMIEKYERKSRENKEK